MRTNFPTPALASSKATKLPTEPHPNKNAHLSFIIEDSSIPVFLEKMFCIKLYNSTLYLSSLYSNTNVSSNQYPISPSLLSVTGLSLYISPNFVVFS